MTDRDLGSLDVSAVAGPITLRWDPHPGATAYVLCQLTVPVGPAQSGAFLSGGLDLMMTRWVLSSGTVRVSEPAERESGHRLVLARHGRALIPVECTLEPGGGDASAPPLESFGPAVDRWDATPRVGTPASEPEAAPPRLDPRPARATVVEPDTPPAIKRVGFVERSMSVRYGPAYGPAGSPSGPLPTIGEAYEGIRPRAAAGSRLPSKRTIAPPDPGEAPGGPPQWAVIASPELLVEVDSARRALRTLRGYFKVCVAGARDRGLLERRSDRVGVPLDAIYALEPDSPRLAAALGCHPSQLVVFVIPDVPAPEGAIRIESTAAGLAASALESCELAD